MGVRKDKGAGWTIGVGARALGIPVRRLRSWAEHGVVEPSLSAEGKGSRRRFTVSDLVKVAMLEECRRVFGKAFRPGQLVETIDAMGKTPLLRDRFVRLQVIRGHAELEPVRLETIVGGVLPRQSLTVVFNLEVIRTCLNASLGCYGGGRMEGA